MKRKLQGELNPMAWNESGNGKNPWDDKEQGPNDLDQIVRNWQRRLSAALGGRRGGGGGGTAAGGGSTGTVLIVALAIIGWGLTGLYRVDAAERGVVLRFGAYQETTMPGLHWHLPYPFESVEKVNVGAVNKFEQTSQMLTADEAFVLVDLAVQFRKSDPIDYRFKVRNPDETLDEVSESAIREVVGKSKLDEILLEDQAEIASRTQTLIQSTLDDYEAGITIVSVNLQKVQFPNQVKDAVQDAVKAREDKQRLILEAEAYRNDVIPRARGTAARMFQDAQAYKERVIATAQGEAARFDLLLSEYQKAPAVTRERLYIESIEDVLKRSSKVLLDAEGGGNLIYLPVDKLLERQAGSERSRESALPDTNAGSLQSRSAERDPRSREDSRTRRTR